MPINPELMALMGGGAMGPAPEVTPGGGGGIDWNLLSMMMGRGAQAFAGEEPQSWQYGLGGVAAGLGESRKFAGAATKARREERGLTQQLIEMMKGGVSPQGIPGLTSMKISPKGEMMLGITPERGAYDDLFGMEPLTLSGMDVGTTPGGGGAPGGAGRPSAVHPFFRNLPEAGSQKPTW